MKVDLPSGVTQRACYQQLGDVLAMEPGYLSALLGTINSIGMETILEQNARLGPYPEFTPAIHDVLSAQGIDLPESESERGPPPYVNFGGTAIIPVSGPLSKHPTSLGHMFGGSSTAGMRKALAMALDDGGVERILFHIDSPGGTVAGTGDLADDIFAARKEKPTASYIEDLGASAAYWIAAQTEHIFASPHAEVGSIGVLHVLQDMSKMAEDMGIKVHAVKAGKHKGRGTPGKELTDEDLAWFQERVDAIYDDFVGAVARGRGIEESAARKLADADVHMAPVAQRLGLVDSIVSFQDALEAYHTSARLSKAPQMGHFSNMSGTADSTAGTSVPSFTAGFSAVEATETLRARDDKGVNALSAKLDDIAARFSKSLDGVVGEMDATTERVNKIADATSSLADTVKTLVDAAETERVSKVDALRQEAATALGKEPEDLAAFTSEDQLKVLIDTARERKATSLRGAPQTKDAEAERNEKLSELKSDLFGKDAQASYRAKLSEYNESPLRHGGRN